VQRTEPKKARPSGSLNFLVSFMFVMTRLVKLAGKLTISQYSTRKFDAPALGMMNIYL